MLICCFLSVNKQYFIICIVHIAHIKNYSFFLFIYSRHLEDNNINSLSSFSKSAFPPTLEVLHE